MLSYTLRNTEKKQRQGSPSHGLRSKGAGQLLARVGRVRSAPGCSRLLDQKARTRKRTLSTEDDWGQTRSTHFT